MGGSTGAAIDKGTAWVNKQSGGRTGQPNVKAQAEGSYDHHGRQWEGFKESMADPNKGLNAIGQALDRSDIGRILRPRDEDDDDTDSYVASSKGSSSTQLSKHGGGEGGKLQAKKRDISGARSKLKIKKKQTQTA